VEKGRAAIPVSFSWIIYTQERRKEMEWWLGYLLVANLVGWLLMGIDKRKAQRHAWRIRESTLFAVALVGGAAGSLAGMYMFRHKTRHARFVWGIPFILLVEFILLLTYGRSLRY
jgi:uncharacterized membrane protein YsdA (DUF1294 family)